MRCAYKTADHSPGTVPLPPPSQAHPGTTGFKAVMLSVGRPGGLAVERRDETVPAAAQGRQVELVGRVVRDGTRRAARWRPADAAARDEVREAVEVLTVGRERSRVAGELAGQVVAGVELVDLVGTVAGGLGAVADEDLVGSDDVSWTPGGISVHPCVPGIRRLAQDLHHLSGASRPA